MDWLLWLLGVAIAVIVGLSVFLGIDTPFVVEQLKHFEPQSAAKALLVGMGLLAISKFF
jgi:hypothetical protein